jgi:hypothetical protein
MGGEEFCREQFSDAQIHALTVCTLVASLLSVVGSSFMLENFFLYDKGRNPLTKLVAWLAFGDYLTAVNNIVKSIMLLHYPDLFSWEVCVVMRAWFQIAAGSTWCYTSVIAYFLYRFMVSRNTSTHARTRSHAPPHARRLTSRDVFVLERSACSVGELADVGVVPPRQLGSARGGRRGHGRRRLHLQVTLPSLVA